MIYTINSLKRPNRGVCLFSIPCFFRSHRKNENHEIHKVWEKRARTAPPHVIHTYTNKQSRNGNGEQFREITFVTGKMPFKKPMQ